MKTPVYLIDGYSLIYRAYFAFMRNPLFGPDGQNTSAVFGFFSSYFQLVGQRRPERLIVVMDSITPTFRHEMYPEYKATRDKTPEDLHAQIPLIEEILKVLGRPALRVNGFEADDVIATLALKYKKEDTPCYILSGDKDLLQLVDKSITVLKPDKTNEGFKELDEGGVKAERGLLPGQITDYLALTGDTADNIPGVKGIGDKTAVKLLQSFHSLDEIYKNLEKIKSNSIRQKLEDDREKAYLSHKLATLVKQVPLPGSPLSSLKPDFQKAIQLFHKFGIKRFDSELGIPVSPEIDVKEKKKAQEGQYSAVLTTEELDNWINRVKSSGLFAFDTETDKLDELSARPVGFSICTSRGKACYIPVRAKDTQCISEETVRLKLSSILTDKSLKLIGQNIKYDYKVLKNWGIEIQNIYFDTMIAAWVINSSYNAYNLDRLAYDYLDYTTIHYDDLIDKKSNKTLADIDLNLVTAYAAEDADIAFRLYEAFSRHLEEGRLKEVFFRIEMPNIKVMAEMELRGIRVLPKELESFSRELESELESIEKEIYSEHGHTFNINSTKQLQEVLFKERGLNPIKRTKTGFSTDYQVLLALAPKDRVCALVLQHRTLSKLKSTYVDSLPKMIHSKTRRIHTHFIQTGTATGRISSKDPNLQNIPIKDEQGRRIREAFVAPPGMKLVSADYSQIELVIMACLSKDKTLIESFLSGRDIHNKTASLLFGVDEEDVTAEQRRVGKTINYAVIYGMSPYRLSQELSIPQKTADLFIQTYFEQYSGVDRFIKETINKAEKQGYVETYFGRRRPVPQINSRNKTEKRSGERIAVNTVIQGTAADIVKLAMIQVNGGLKKHKLNAHLLLQVHDELIFEIANEDIKKALPVIRDIMENVVALRVPLKVNLEYGECWGGMH